MGGWGGDLAPADNEGAGNQEWGRMTGIGASHPLMGGGPRMTGIPPIDSTGHLGAGAAASMPAEGATVATGDIDVFDDWRDLFDFKNSPGPWVLLMALVAIGFVQLRVHARGGPAKLNASLG